MTTSLLTDLRVEDVKQPFHIGLNMPSYSEAKAVIARVTERHTELTRISRLCTDAEPVLIADLWQNLTDHHKLLLCGTQADAVAIHTLFWRTWNFSGTEWAVVHNILKEFNDETARMLTKKKAAHQAIVDWHNSDSDVAPPQLPDEIVGAHRMRFNLAKSDWLAWVSQLSEQEYERFLAVKLMWH